MPVPGSAASQPVPGSAASQPVPGSAASQPEWGELAGEVRAAFDEVQAAREVGLADCRRSIRAAGSAIRAIHRRRPDDVATRLVECEQALRSAQSALRPFPSVAHAGFLHDAEKEFAEARLTEAIVAGEPLRSASDLGVQLPAWLNGLAEAASELRRHLLDRLRSGDTAAAERLLVAMDDIHEFLAGIDYPDAITGGLRRTNDALRAVLERTRSDLTTTLLQQRLQAALEGHPNASA